MKKPLRNLLWLALALAVALSLLWEFVPLPDASARLNALPLRGFGYAGRDVPLTEVETSIYGPARTLKRLYQIGSQRVLVVLIDGSRNRHAVHDPTFCFRGAGWTIAAAGDTPIPGGVGKLVRLAKGAESAQAMYWWSDGQHRYTSTLRYWWQTTWRRLTFGRSSGEPVLFVVQPVAGETVRWETLVQQWPILFEL